MPQKNTCQRTVFPATTLTAAVLLALGGCSGGGGSSSGDSGDDDDVQLSGTVYSADKYDVDGVLEEEKESSSGSVSAADVDDKCEGATEGLCNMWGSTIATLEHSDSLMGYIDRNLMAWLQGLEDAGWNYDHEGQFEFSIDMGNKTVKLNGYSVPIEIDGEISGATIYTDVSEKPDPLYSELDYRDESISIESEDHDMHHALTLIDEGERRILYEVEVGKYADRETSCWEVLSGNEYVHYNRKDGDDTTLDECVNEDDVKKLPNTNRAPDGASDARALMSVIDVESREIFFENVTSSEKHNDQMHFALRLKDLEEDSDGNLQVGSSTRINLTRAFRTHAKTDLDDGDPVDIVSSKAETERYLLIGRVTGGMWYLGEHVKNSYSDTDAECVALPDDLDFANFERDMDAQNCPSTKPSALSDVTDVFTTFTSDPGNYSYLPKSGDTTYGSLDLRYVNFFDRYNKDYDVEWLYTLPTGD